jgi:Mce-associated membrane protein
MITDARRNGSNLDELAALAEQAEADAAEAEAHAAAVRARARAIRARQRIRDLDMNVDTMEAIAEPDATGDLPNVDETADPEPEPSPTRKRRWLSRLARPSRSAILRAVAGVVVVAALIASGLVLWQHHKMVEERQRADQFAAAAREGVLALTSLDFAKAQEDVQRVLDNATGAFKADFQKRGEDFRKIVADSKVVARGNVYATAVESMTKDSAVVLVAATSEVTGPDGAKDKPRAWRLEVTVTRDGDRLKMSNVEFVQ